MVERRYRQGGLYGGRSPVFAPSHSDDLNTESSYDSNSLLFDLIQNLDRKHPWRLEAACRGTGQSLHFSPANGAKARHAKEICADCPVREQCRMFAVEGNEVGIWGGEYFDRPR